MKHVIPVHGIKTTAQKLQKLSKDCNMTAGLEAKLQLAVGARVILCLNIDTNPGLVNGAIGTMVSIRPNHVTAQFHQIDKPYNVDMQGQEHILNHENFYIYRRQFLPILAYMQ